MAFEYQSIGGDEYVVVDTSTGNEVCLMNTYEDESMPAIKRAQLVADALNHYLNHK